MSFNPLAIILNQNKLTGPNYVDWKRNLDSVLTAEGCNYILTEERLDLPRPMHLGWKEKDIKNGLKLYFRDRAFARLLE